MEVVDKRKGKEDWYLGDVLVSKVGNLIGLIVQSNNGKYCLIDITPNKAKNYSTMDDSYYGNCCGTLKELYSEMHKSWHKVNAKLVIE